SAAWTRPRPRAAEHSPLLALIRRQLQACAAAADPWTQARLKEEWLEWLNHDNAAEILRSLSSEEVTGPLGVAALERWLSLDPTAAADWIATRADATPEHAALDARQLLPDQSGFQSYLDHLPDGDWKQSLLSAAGFEIAASDPEKAIAFANGLKAPDLQAAVMQAAAFSWAQRDPDAARAWTGTIADPDLREQWIAAGAKGWATLNPQPAADWLVSSVQNAELLRETAASIVRSWAATDPGAAASWIARFPDSPLKVEALETLVSFWSAADPAAASAWIARQPDGFIHRQATAILARSTAEWVASFGSRRRRTRRRFFPMD